MKKKFLVNLYDRYSKERIAQLIVTAVNMEEAFARDIDWHERKDKKEAR